MNRKKNLIFFLLLILLVNCSFDDKSGIWKESIEEEKRVVELEKKQQTEINRIKIYSSENSYSKEVILNKEISLSSAKKKFLMGDVWFKLSKFYWKYLFIWY